jgi:hypothetical protein
VSCTGQCIGLEHKSVAATTRLLTFTLHASHGRNCHPVAALHTELLYCMPERICDVPWSSGHVLIYINGDVHRHSSNLALQAMGILPARLLMLQSCCKAGRVCSAECRAN